MSNSAAKSCNKTRGCRRESSKTVTLLHRYFLLNQSFYLFKAAQYSGLLCPEALWRYLLGSQIAHSCKHSCQSILDHHLPLKSPTQGLYRAQKQFYDSIPFSNSSKFTLELCWFSLLSLLLRNSTESRRCTGHINHFQMCRVMMQPQIWQTCLRASASRLQRNPVRQKVLKGWGKEKETNPSRSYFQNLAANYVFMFSW